MEFIGLPGNPVHEGINSHAVDCRFYRETPIGPEELRAFASGLMEAGAAACHERGAKDIGHIKAYIEHPSGFLYADTTGRSGDVSVAGKDGKPTERFRLVINSVIFGIDETSVREATEEALERLSKKHGLSREPLPTK